jgi:ribosomal protein S18 acetylase RimI-like enzyme
MSPDTKTSLPAALRIRRASLLDAEVIATLGAETFKASFGPQNTPENVERHLTKSYSVTIQERQLADPKVTYLLAEMDGRSAGYACVVESEPPPCVTGPAPIEVLRFYVVSDFHGSGIAQALMDACAADARARGGRTLWLGVWDQNPRAIRFYTKWGFEDVGGQIFMMGEDPQHDRVLSHSLEPRAS